MAGRLIGAWNPALDSAGVSISGAKLYTYIAGTTTPKTTYTTVALSTPQANPVVADSAGRFSELWAADGATFDLKWTDAAGTQIALFQSVQALGSTATGAVTRDFGADGRFNLESRGGVTYLEGGDPSPDNIGGKVRVGGWAGTQADTIVLDGALVQGTSSPAAGDNSLNFATTAHLQASGGKLPGIPGGATVLGGKIGETDIATNPGFAAANGVASNITSATLEAGAYRITGYIGITPAGGAATYLSGGLTTITATLPVGVQGSFTDGQQTFPSTVFQQRPTGEAYLNVSVPTTVYLVGQASFAGTCTMLGGLRWTRL